MYVFFNSYVNEPRSLYRTKIVTFRKVTAFASRDLNYTFYWRIFESISSKDTIINIVNIKRVRKVPKKRYLYMSHNGKQYDNTK